MKGNKNLIKYLINLSLRIVYIHKNIKKNGSFYLHCDSHASHHIKLILDYIFGSCNFRNEIIWCYKSGGASKIGFSKKHDTILKYSKSNIYTFNPLFVPYSMKNIKQDKDGFFQIRNGKRVTYNDNGAIMQDWWEISIINSHAKERLGYPTQKPELLLERIILASSNEGDIVADFYLGSGTTAAACKNLGRHFVGCDISDKSIEMVKNRLNEKK